jgi:ferric-dicitrate binding protein FerR (iron transport regulator)
MTDGDQLGTGFMSRAEILINPAASLCLDEQAEVRAVNTTLTAARFELLRGDLMIQAGNPMLLSEGSSPFRPPVNRTGSMTEALAFEITTPHGILTIVKDGLYRLSIEPSATRVDVFEGEVALGDRSLALRRKAQIIKGGKRATWTGDHPLSPAISVLKLKSFDQFDRWHFLMAKHGAAVGIEGAAVATGATGRYRIVPEFQLKEGQMLSTENASHVEMRINLGTSLFLDQLTQIRAVKTDNEEAAFELLHGTIIINSEERFPMRPIRIITPQGNFTVKHGSFARFEVNALDTAVEVRRGEVRNGLNAVSSGKRLLLKGGTRPSQEWTTPRKDALDLLERWSLGLLRAGTVTRHEGGVILERHEGGRLDLEKNASGFAQLLEGGHLSTERGGRAAMTFGAGSIHVNENSEIVAVSSSERQREFEVLRGAAIVYSEPASPTRLRVSTPHGLAEISGGSIVRFDVDPSATRIKVRSGSLLLQTRAEPSAKSTIRVKENQTATLSAGSPPQISRVPDTADDFDRWSIGAREFPFQGMIRR